VKALSFGLWIFLPRIIRIFTYSHWFYIVILRCFAVVSLEGLKFLTAEFAKVYTKDAKF